VGKGLKNQELSVFRGSLPVLNAADQVDPTLYKLLSKHLKTGKPFVVAKRQSKYFHGGYLQVKSGIFWMHKNKPIDKVGKIEAPTLFIHGDKDWVVGDWHSRELYNKTNTEKKLVVIKDGPHAEYLIRKFPDRIYKEIDSWLDKTM